MVLTENIQLQKDAENINIITEEEAAQFFKPNKPKKFNLLSIPILGRIMKSRWYQTSLLAVDLLVFALVIFAGFYGDPVGNSNFSIIFVWIVWWALLIMFLVPFLGRFWCTICPIPAIGEWVQRGGRLISKDKGRDKYFGLGKRWPKKLRGMWLATFGFLSIAIFSGLLTTIPRVTAIMLSGLIGLSVVISLVFKKRTFCRYVCPVGGFIGLYSQASALEVRVKDSDVCKGHRPKDCVTGNEKGYGCPWMEFPGQLETNTYCGLCMECYKVCPKDNISLNIRSFGSDLSLNPNRRIDEAYKSNVMLGAALLYSIVLLGPYPSLKEMANFDSFNGFLKYAGFFLGVLAVTIPAFFFLSAYLTKKAVTDNNLSVKDIYRNYGYATVPLGLMTWIGFSLLILLPNWSYIINVINDPFGWGWHLFGMEWIAWQPVMTGIIPTAITILIVIGLYLSLRITNAVSQQLFGTNSQNYLKGFSINAIFLMIFASGLIYAFAG